MVMQAHAKNKGDSWKDCDHKKQKQEHSPFEKDLLQQNFELLKRVKELEEPFDAPFIVEILGHRFHGKARVRPAFKEIAKTEIDESKIPVGLFV